MRLLAGTYTGDGWIESKSVSRSLSTECKDPSPDPLGDDETAEAAEGHPSDNEQEEQLGWHERHAGQPDGIRHGDAKPGSNRREGPHQQGNGKDRPHAPLDQPLRD